MSAVALRRPPAEDAEASGPLTARRVGWAGVALAFLAFFVARPPLTIRSPIPTVILACAAADSRARAFALLLCVNRKLQRESCRNCL